MSATMSGLDSLSDWLDAHLFLTSCLSCTVLYRTMPYRHVYSGRGHECNDEWLGQPQRLARRTPVPHKLQAGAADRARRV